VAYPESLSARSRGSDRPREENGIKNLDKKGLKSRNSLKTEGDYGATLLLGQYNRTDPASGAAPYL
jgi:hypothetical protein